MFGRGQASRHQGNALAARAGAVPKRRHAASWGFLTLLFCAGCPPPGPPAIPPNYGESVRMGTFNVQFLPGSDDDDTTRSRRICDRIRAAGYDIIALNEVFDEEARDVFVAELRGSYPHYIAYLGDDAVGSQDSGLALFSRFPFDPLPRWTYRVEPDDLSAVNGAAGAFNDVAFIEYDEDVFPDNWAAKGVGFVRIRNPHTNRVYNVAFTHLQASYPEDEDDLGEWREPIDARAAQLRDVRRVIEGSLEPYQLSREDIFVLGDLNIDGDLADDDLGGTAWGRPNLWEWVQRFDTPGSFFTDVLMDAWAFEQSPDDRGLTNLYHWGPDYSPDQGARLDYILRNRPQRDPAGDIGRLYVQHLTQAHNMRDGAPFIESGMGQAGIHELSDHIGLNADINQWAPHCNPLEARTPPLDSYIAGTITYPGSMQWLRFDSPGTYAFAIGNAGMQFRVYESRDMSTPVPQYYDETVFIDLGPATNPILARKFHVPEAPLFCGYFTKTAPRPGTTTFWRI